MDYCFPDWVTKVLKAPSLQTQMESSMVGITTMMLASLCLVSFLIFNNIITGFWYIFLAVASEIGVLSFQFSLLSTTYQGYHQYKMENGKYPKDYQLELKIQEAKKIRDELNELMEVKHE
jgi:hypothetical protein